MVNPTTPSEALAAMLRNNGTAVSTGGETVAIPTTDAVEIRIDGGQILSNGGEQAATEITPIADGEQPAEERGNTILEEAAALSELEFARKKKEFQKRLHDEAGWELSLSDLTSGVSRLRRLRLQQQRQQSQPGPQPTRAGSLIRDQYCKEGAGLLPQHRQLLVDSAIKPEIARERGYRTIERKKELKNYRFSPSQQIIPTMLCPLYDPKGQPAGWQHRPDIPRFNKDDPPKPIKYETPLKWQMRIDVHPSLSKKIITKRDGPYFDTIESPGPIGNPNIPLFITEGVRKADSAVSIDLCCLALLGVWAWRGANDIGGLTALSDWDDIALNRTVYIAFDSDVMTKAEVHTALRRLSAFLVGRHATVKFVYLPSGPYGEKVGLDDFIAAQIKAGVTPEQIRTKLFEFATDELRPLPKSNPELPRDDNNPVKWPFTLKEDGVWSTEKARDGEEYQLFVCSPLDIIAATRNRDSKEWSRLLVFKDDDGCEHQYALAMQLMAGDGAAYRESLLYGPSYRSWGTSP
jgi:hypothetical protein